MEIELEKLELLVKLTKDRQREAWKVIDNPCDDNLTNYNYITEIQYEIKKKLNIYPKLTKEEEIASEIWLRERHRLY